MSDQQNMLKEWFYVSYTDAHGGFTEADVYRCKEEHLVHKMDERLKFSGISTKAHAYRISPKTGKPNFNSILLSTQIPF